MSLNFLFSYFNFFNIFRLPFELQVKNTFNNYHILLFIIICLVSSLLICRLQNLSTFLKRNTLTQLFFTDQKLKAFEKKKTVKFNLPIDCGQLHQNGSVKSTSFGTDLTKFYWIAKQRANYYSLHLYLASCDKDKIQVDCSVGSTATIRGNETTCPNNQHFNILLGRTIKGGTFFNERRAKLQAILNLCTLVLV